MKNESVVGMRDVGEQAARWQYVVGSKNLPLVNERRHQLRAHSGR